MIIITTNYKGKTFEHKYEGQIYLELAGRHLNVDWTRLPHNHDGLFTWHGNGFDTFWIEDIVSIKSS